MSYFFRKHLTSTSAALLQGRCSACLGTGYIRVFEVTVGVSTTVIDSPNSLHPLSSNLLSRPSFLEEFLDKGVATRLYNSPWVHVVYFNCVIKDLAWAPLNLPGRKNDYK